MDLTTSSMELLEKFSVGVNWFNLRIKKIADSKTNDLIFLFIKAIFHSLSEASCQQEMR